MQTTKWFHVARWPGASGPDPALSEAVARAAVELGLTLRAPVAGWVSSVHSRDGKSWPCRERTDGARPVWLWAGQQ